MVRADARENHARILAAAREALAEDGDTSMNQIAQRAGVGAGTLYRNFATREELVLAVYQFDVDEVLASVGGLLAAHPPVTALRLWTLELVDAMRRKHGLGDALTPSASRAMIERTYGPVIDAITTLLRAGQADGSIRPDADPRDYLQLTGALWRAAAGPEDRSQPMLELILDGLRTDRGRA